MYDSKALSCNPTFQGLPFSGSEMQLLWKTPVAGADIRSRVRTGQRFLKEVPESLGNLSGHRILTKMALVAMPELLLFVPRYTVKYVMRHLLEVLRAQHGSLPSLGVNYPEDCSASKSSRLVVCGWE